MDRRTKQWFVILQQKEIECTENEGQLATYRSIKSYSSNGKKHVALSLRDIAQRTHYSYRQISKIIPELKKIGLIKIIGQESRRGGIIPVYKVCIDNTLNIKKCVMTSQLNSESVQSVPKSVKLVGTKIIQSNKVYAARNFTHEQAWEEFSSVYLKSLGISDPAFIKAARQAFLEKSKAASERAVQAFIDTQRKITPPDMSEYKNELWPEEKNNG